MDCITFSQMEMELLKKLCGETDDASCLKAVAYTSGMV